MRGGGVLYTNIGRQVARDLYTGEGGGGLRFALCYLAQLLTLGDDQLTVSNFVRAFLIQQRTLPLTSHRQTT